MRIVYKYYQLPGHDRALPAAYTAHAAHKQGKFWDIQGVLFADPMKLSDKELAIYAKAAGLEMESYLQDIAAPETHRYVEADIKAADALGLDGTPMIFINGRKIPLEKLKPFVEELEAWMKLEIELAGQKPAEASERYHEMRKELGVDEDEPPVPGPAPSGSASAGPSAMPSASAGAPSTSASAGAPSASVAPSASAGPPKKKPKPQ